MPETDRRNRPRPPPPPPPEPTRQPTTEEPTRQPTSEDTTNNEELIYVSTVEVNEITDIATESEKLTTEESTPEGVTDQIREMATELDEGATVERIVIMPASDESDTDYKEFIPGEIPDYFWF